jgi:hypothetical protein
MEGMLAGNCRMLKRLLEGKANFFLQIFVSKLPKSRLVYVYHHVGKMRKINIDLQQAVLSGNF